MESVLAALRQDLLTARILRPEDIDVRLRLDELDVAQVCRAKIDEARYKNLLWKMRNHLVHELRFPGRGVPLSRDDSTPYYHGCGVSEIGAGAQTWELDFSEAITGAGTDVSGIGAGAQTWELYIPSRVLSDLVTECGARLKTHCRKNSINPYDSFVSHSSWFADAR
ncbi:MAG: hypothetical protein HY691_11135 [Chloroflexi bacterium]|nr:hypothetical protein [Chloroflexota bacterium]